MKKFRFKLQVLLEHRKAKEDRLLGELGEVRREEADEVAWLEDLAQRFEQGCAALENALRASEPTATVAKIDDYARATKDDIKVQELTIEAVRARVEAKRLEVVQAMKERQVLEALRDRQERDYLLALARAEQNELDEMSAVRYARGM